MLTVLVTGATGFIGSQLVRDLAGSGYRVGALIRKTTASEHLRKRGIDISYGDITDLRSLIEACKGIDVVVHLAALTSSAGRDYERSFMVNVVGSQNLIDACKINQVKKVIFVSTQADNPSAYATTKRQAEKLFRDSDLDVAIIKSSLVYGPLVKGLFGGMTQFMRRFPIIPIVGSGRYPMKPIYVGDVTQAIISCIERDDLKTEYFISGPTELTYSQYVGVIAKAMGLRRGKVRVPYFLTFVGVSIVSQFLKRFPITTDTLKGLVNARVYDSTEAEEDLGFAPLPLEEGLRRVFAQIGGEA